METTPDRSTFVTVLAWIFIVLAGFVTAISLMQNAMVWLMLPTDELSRAASDPEAAEHLTPFVRFLMGHFHLVFLAPLILAVAVLASSIGLLRRLNWARLAIIGLLGLGIAWQVAGVALQGAMMPPMPGLPADEAGQRFAAMVTLIRVFSVVMAVGVSAVFAWIIKRLLSPEIAAEFRSG